VPVAERRLNARREMEKLRKAGVDVQPVEIEGRTIARSFWGKGWCTHLESFGDFSNRLPRGRTYVRNGSVCHLAIAPGEIDAIVSGSELYNVEVRIDELKKAKWKTLKQRCTGRIGSLVELLQGRLSDEIMGVVADRENGLFPLPGEIRFQCDCPDWAGMCKHIAAVMYGIGARLDTRPELLFLLRGVDHDELIASDAAADAIAGTGSSRTRRRSLDARNLEGVFGVELEDTPRPPAKTPKPKRTRQKAAPQKVGAKTGHPAGPGTTTSPEKAAPKPAPKRTRKRKPFKPTARAVANLRNRLGMTRPQFARAVGVSTQTVKNWEEATGPLNPNAKGLAGLNRLHEQAGR